MTNKLCTRLFNSINIQFSHANLQNQFHFKWENVWHSPLPLFCQRDCEVTNAANNSKRRPKNFIGFSLFCHPFFAVRKWQSEVKRLWYSLVKVTVSITRLSISKCSIFVLQKHPTLFVITRCFATVNAVAILILYFRFEKFIIDTVCERVPALTPTCASDYSTFT